MTTASTKSGKIVSVITDDDKDFNLTESDAEMDARAVEAVKTAIEKAKFCKKPIAKYDDEKKAAYIEYANGEKKYAK